MPITVDDAVAALGRTAPWGKAGGWDPVGLQLGDPHATVSSIAVAHELTEAVVDRLVARPVDRVVAYHPLLFRPTTRLVAGSSATGRAFRLVAAGIAVAVVHTAFDVAPGGGADALADALALGEVRPFGPNWGPDTVKVVTFVPVEHADAVAAAAAGVGAGVIGNYSACSFRTPGIGTFLAGDGANPVTGDIGALSAEEEIRLEMVAPGSAVDRVVAAVAAAHPYEEPAYDVYDVRGNAGFIGRTGRLPAPTPLRDLAARVAGRLGGTLRVAGDRDAPVSTVAVIPGSGGSFLAGTGGVDVVVTGDVGHHQARESLDRGTAVVDPGHAATERPGMARLYAAVAQIVDDPVDLSDLAADPWEPVWKS
jgi:dinuclear metal center YbgI/SA1388 family protein